MGETKIKPSAIKTHLLALAEVTSSQGSITDHDITNASITFTVPSGASARKVKISGFTNVYSNSATDVAALLIRDGSDTSYEFFYFVPGNGSARSAFVQRILTLTPGSYTFKLHLLRDGGSGTFTNYCTTTLPTWIAAELI